MSLCQGTLLKLSVPSPTIYFLLFSFPHCKGEMDMMVLNIGSNTPSIEIVKNLLSRIGGSRGGRARRAPPHLPGILVFDDILGHIV